MFGRATIRLGIGPHSSLLFIGVTGATARDLPLPPQHIHGTAQNAISSQQPCEQCAELANNLPMPTANFKP